MKNRLRSASRRNGTADLVTCSLVTFAHKVRAVIARIGQGERERFGHRKVFISAAYASLVAAGHLVGALEAFKVRLMLARTAGLLQLARADLVAAMPTDAVIVSETHDRGAEYHFIIDPTATDPGPISAEVS